jgi:D-alanyl-D-alanine carboxypeptidase
MANWASTQALGDPKDPDWQAKNLKWIEPVKGERWQVYAPAAEAFQGLLSELAERGYPLKSSGGYNYRTIRGGKSLSQHAFGNAIDLNAEENPMLKKGDKVQTNLPPDVGEIAAKYGLEWGGNWKRPDAMHFEWKGGGAQPPQQGQAEPSLADTPAARVSGPVEAAGGGFGADAGPQLFMPPEQPGRQDLAEGMVAGAFPDKPKKPVTWKDRMRGAAKGFGAALSDMGGDMAAPMSLPSQIQTTMTPGQMVSPIDPQQADAQRQQLAAAMARLNSGRLF